MPYNVGSRVTLPDGAAAIVVEVVPPGRMPRSRVPAIQKPRPVESYVVTTLAAHTVLQRGRGEGVGTRRVATVTCRRRWPDPRTLQPVTQGRLPCGV